MFMISSDVKPTVSNAFCLIDIHQSINELSNQWIYVRMNEWIIKEKEIKNKKQN